MNPGLARNTETDKLSAGSASVEAKRLRETDFTDFGSAETAAPARADEPIAANDTVAAPHAPQLNNTDSDPQSREVVFRPIEAKAYGRLPEGREQALRRHRAYDGALARGEPASIRQGRTDLQA